MSSSESRRRGTTRGGAPSRGAPPAPTAPITRWAERAPRGGSIAPVHGVDGVDRLSAAEEWAAELFRQAPPPPAFGSLARARVWFRLAGEGRRRGVGRPRLAAWVATAVLLLCGGAVIAARGLDRWWVSRRAPSQAAAAARDPATNPLGHRRQRRLGPSIDAPAPSPVPMPAMDPGATTGLGREAQLLKVAVERLRLGRDAAGALDAVAQYRRAFPEGTLASEASTLRIDALLMLNRESEALRELDGLSLGPGLRDRELRVLRSELRAKSGSSDSESRNPSGDRK